MWFLCEFNVLYYNTSNRLAHCLVETYIISIDIKDGSFKELKITKASLLKNIIAEMNIHLDTPSYKGYIRGELDNPEIIKLPPATSIALIASSPNKPET